MVRNFIDSVLQFIDAETLTDDEFESLEITTAGWDKETYVAIRTVLHNRESVSGKTKQLRLYFIAKGVDLRDAPKAAPAPNSNIFIGAPLE